MTTQLFPSSPEEEIKYFDLHTHGYGYLNRIRTITPKKGATFVACSITALVGPTKSVEYRYFDLKIVTEKAAHLILGCQEAVESGKKVLVSFTMADLWIDQFVYQHGDKKGQTGAALKARLIGISMIKVDKEQVYKAPPKSPPTHSTNTTDSHAT